MKIKISQLRQIIRESIEAHLDKAPDEPVDENREPSADPEVEQINHQGKDDVIDQMGKPVKQKK